MASRPKRCPVQRSRLALKHGRALRSPAASQCGEGGEARRPCSVGEGLFGNSVIGGGRGVEQLDGASRETRRRAWRDASSVIGERRRA